jgi:hypothetical protein
LFDNPAHRGERNVEFLDAVRLLFQNAKRHGLLLWPSLLPDLCDNSL